MIFFLKLLPVLMGIVCIGAALLPERYQHFSQPVRTEGEIISTVKQKVRQYGNETDVIAPVVRYRTEYGLMTGTARQFVPEWQYLYQTGDKIAICYDKTRPDQFQICHDSRYVFRKTLCLTAGIGILTAYAVLSFKY